MKFELVRNLKGNERLAKNVMNAENKMLLKEGSILNRAYINRLKENGVLYVYIDNLEEEIDNDINKSMQNVEKKANNINNIDVRIKSIKRNALDEMPGIFNSLLSKEPTAVKRSIAVMDRIVECIIDEGAVNTNLFELNKYDNYTYIHCIDTSMMAVYIAMKMRMRKQEIKKLGISSILHDIGKIKIPESILNKKENLTQDEFNEIKNHTIYGYSILRDAGIKDDLIIDGVLNHHERYDGKGYPFGLSDTQISDFGKIISICDVFTAISANRSYRSRYNPNEAYECIISGSGTKFDPKIVKHFRNCFAIYPLGCRVRLNNGIEGYVCRQNPSFPDRPVIIVKYNSETKIPIEEYEIDLLEKTNLVVKDVI